MEPTTTRIGAGTNYFLYFLAPELNPTGRRFLPSRNGETILSVQRIYVLNSTIETKKKETEQKRRGKTAKYGFPSYSTGSEENQFTPF